MVDFLKLEKLAEAVGIERWKQSENTVEFDHPDSEGFPIAVIDIEGVYPESLSLAFAEYIAAFDPAASMSIIAKLKIAMVALELITGERYEGDEASNETIAAQALARIKSV